MATTTDKNAVFKGKRRSVWQLLGRNTDTNEESNAQKIDISADLTGPDGNAPARVDVEAIEYNVQGFGSLELLWDNSTNERIARLSGAGEVNWYDSGGRVNPATGTGDILLTTYDAAAGDTYDITLWLKHQTTK